MEKMSVFSGGTDTNSNSEEIKFNGNNNSQTNSGVNNANN